ncbi:tetratricopeptide repeat protein [Brachyspira murdochii]|uniref:tetratricopeptide repeat protein n=1 Tax=Brachyspira murdochii TaxID=84378 RepID=UPI003AAEDA54
MGEYKEAIKDYDKAIELKPNMAYLYNDRGWVKKNAGLYKEALKDYKKALELEPNNEYAIENMKSLKKEYGLK